MAKKKVVVVSNFLNSHTKPLCDAFVAHQDVDFTFVANERIGSESTLIKKASNDEPYVIKTYESKDALKRAKRLAKEADILIIGMAKNSWVHKPKRNQITFLYTERPFKKQSFLFLRRIKRIFEIGPRINKRTYLLCASSYTKSDYDSCGLFKNRALMFGYFPTGNIYSDIRPSKQLHDGPISLLWSARMVELKNPEHALEAADALYEAGIDFTLDFVGDGPIKGEVEGLANAKPYADKIVFHGAVSNDANMKIMAEKDIFLFTSNHLEGWGAVLNEAMSSGCACISSVSAGATRFLLNGKNGSGYGSLQELKELVLRYSDKRIAAEIGNEARKTMTDKWNAKAAVENVLAFVDKITKKEEIDSSMINNGPATFLR